MAGRSRSQSRTPRKGGAARQQQTGPGQAATGTKAFGKSATMPTAKVQVAQRQQATKAFEQAIYLGAPPPDQKVLHCRLVLPTERIPQGLDNAAAFDIIRREHHVWITRPEPNILDLASTSMTRLQQGLRAVNWAIHDMRLSDEPPTVRFFVQMPTNAAADATIKFERNSRPHVEDKAPPYPSIESSIERLNKQMRNLIMPASQCLTGLDKDLKMRVSFGLLNVRQKKNSVGNDVSYEDFQEIIKVYSRRGGASLETKLSNEQDAYKTLQRLIDPQTGVLVGQADVTYGCNLTLLCQDSHIRAEVLVLGSQNVQLSTPRMTTPELSERLNWTTAAPDMSYDWNLQVEAWEEVEEVSQDLLGLLKKVSFQFEGVGSTGLTSIKFPRLQIDQPGQMGSSVAETRLQVTATVPYQESPWAVEISITRVWKGLNTTVEPEVHWGIQAYGVHWEDAINCVEVGGRRKDWGADLEFMWPGDSLDEGFKNFVESIAMIQRGLDEVEKEDDADALLL